MKAESVCQLYKSDQQGRLLWQPKETTSTTDLKSHLMRTNVCFSVALMRWMASIEISESFGMEHCRQRKIASARSKGFVVATSSSDDENFGLDDRFERWRFLQQVLDKDCDGETTNKVLSALLFDVVKAPSHRPVFQSEDAGGKLSSQQERLIQEINEQVVLTELEKLMNGEVELPIGSASNVIDILEALLPDPDEDEDAVRGLWDTINEIHGRESVKLNEINESMEWKSRCLVARVMLYFDFLSHGVVTAS